MINKQINKLITITSLFMMLAGISSAQTNGFVQAYDSMHQVFSVWYPMGDWKAIDWDSLNGAIRPKIIAAGTTDDTTAFYIAMASYIDGIHDGHTNVRHGWVAIRAAARYREIGGSYGFTVIGTDDGRILVRLINPGSPAAQAGMLFGAELLEINDHPVQSVLDTVPTRWADRVPATHEFRKMNQNRLIGRAPVGASMKVKFTNRGSTTPVTAVLTAVDDGYATFDQTTLYPAETGPEVTSAILDGGYGYIKVNSLYGDEASAVTIYTTFRDALNGFIASDAPGLVLDFRINMGGYDALAAAMAGFFYDQNAVYEKQSWYNPDTDSLERWPLHIPHFNPQTLEFDTNAAYPPGTLFTEPQGVLFNRPVMVLVGPRSISSGEGIPMMLRKLPNCKTIGFHGTNGSFALVERAHYLFPPPSDFYVRYPYGVSMNENYIIQLDSDSTMTGGVSPDIRVPVNDTVINQLYIDSLDVELRYALKMLKASAGIVAPPNAGKEFYLEPISPNPLSQSTIINYHLQHAGSIDLSVFDIYGRHMMSLVKGEQASGRHTISFNAASLPSGVYFFRLSTISGIITQKCILQ